MSFGDLPPPPPPDATGYGPVLPGGQPLGSPWARIGARLIDALILIAATTVLAAAFGGLDDPDEVNAGATILSMLVAVAYEVGFIGTIGATPGKLALRLRVVAQEDGRTPPGWDKAFLRYAPFLVALIPVIGPLLSLGVLVLSLVWLGTDDRRRTVYDRAATTYVVKV